MISRSGPALRERVHRRFVDEHAGDGADERTVRDVLFDLVRDEAPVLSDADVARVVDDVTLAVVGLGPLERLFADPDVTEVMVNGPGNTWVERAGRLEPVDLDLGRGDLERLIERVVAPLGLRCDRASPEVDARLPDGSRLHAVIPPVALDGPYVAVRRFLRRPLPLAALAPDPECEELLTRLVVSGWNLVVSGGTSSGKTTLLNALSRHIPRDERVVTVEETPELALQHPHLVRLATRAANSEGAGAVSVRDLVRASLRMRPDRILVGEIRGAEALDVLDAMSTGHDGSLTTIHANGTGEAVERFHALASRGAQRLPPAAIRRQLLACVDAVVQVERRPAGERRVRAVGETRAQGEQDVVRPLWTREDGIVASPERPARRTPAP